MEDAISHNFSYYRTLTTNKYLKIPIDNMFITCKTHTHKKEVKQPLYMPGQALRITEGGGFQISDNRHMKVVCLSALHTGRLYPKEIFLLLIVVRGHIHTNTKFVNLPSI
jgi:hypothetical protein